MILAKSKNLLLKCEPGFAANVTPKREARFPDFILNRRPKRLTPLQRKQQTGIIIGAAAE